MVNLSIPKHYTASPSSFSGTPHLTINRDATIDLDSTNAFEGPEKLLEVWFSPSADAIPASAALNGLKSVPFETWTEMLDLVNCKVLSVVESQDMDAYLLSESSMFVFPHKLILKTCGTTTLLCGLPRMLEIAALTAGFPHVAANPLKGIPAAATPYRVFYSRKNFLFPDKQRGPHRSWRNEVKYLDNMFQGGSAYMVGKMNGEHWYLYITGPGTMLTPPSTPEHEKFPSLRTETKVIQVPGEMEAIDRAGVKGGHAEDETLEVLMTDLDEENAKQFYLEHASAVAEGRYLQQAREARQNAHDSLGFLSNGANGLNGHAAINGNGGYMHHDEGFDVFSNTSSENGEFSSREEAFPEELTTEGHALGTVVSDVSGLSDVYPVSKYPDARIDAYLFTPCGFSANGVIPAPDRSINAGGQTHYFTVHVTPEPHCSYASFETNVPSRQTGRETAEIVEHVVDIFKPGRFTVTLFEAKPVVDETTGPKDPIQEIKALERAAARRHSRMDTIKGYRRVDRIVHDLDDYDLIFRYYERNDWKGGAPRLGEINL
ncbi:adenosylmethionine decarboxylase [Xylona heveae TC161]|uniref:Adenosylmethionine decarboxylase n=1 Tax=Xylona heveae (strain CBS 132557 / TC161) TaxID=1328760 RepID=A0A165AD19_XYLHT|nr:adenosylmethionine decarboxylase [Xylona heveae TC161]KZF20277.1 adenosylmethionine decarboxylase [Xylona heveae TC161]